MKINVTQLNSTSELAVALMSNPIESSSTPQKSDVWIGPYLWEKSHVQGVISFGFALWREILKPITKRSNRNCVITFDSYLKTAIIVITTTVISKLLWWRSFQMAVSFQIGCYFGNVFFDSHLKSFHHVLNKLQIQPNLQISGWYLGCFKENLQDRVFNVSAGNYQVHDTSAQECTSACAFLNQSYAARNGDLCLCGSGSYNKYGLASSESLCDGMHSQQIPYNATTYIRVYSTQSATGGLKIHGPEIGWLFQETKFTVVVGQGMKALLPIVNSLHSFVLNLDL